VVQLADHLDMKSISRLNVLANPVLMETKGSTTAGGKAVP
jgi:hypothetical protein